MKKAGILTFSAADNFGALMQCYALKHVLDEQGYDTQVINYWPKYLRKDYRLMFDKEEFMAGVHSGIKCLWRSVIYIRIKNLPKAIRKRYRMDLFRKRYLNPTKRCKKETDLQMLETKDLYVAGSDQIWNPDLTGGKLDPVFFLRFAPASSKKVTYAASTGSTPTKEQALEYRKYTKELNKISLREKKAAIILGEILQQPISVDKDPTLLLNRADWEKLVLKNKSKKRYILFFSIYYSPEQFEYVNKISDEMDLPVVHFFYGRLAKRLVRNGGTCYFDDPQELLTRIKNADYIVTDSFHVTIFSILFEKEFVTFPSGKWSERIEELLKNQGMEDKLMWGTKNEVCSL